MSKNTFKSIGHPFENFRDTSKNSSDAEFSDEELKFPFDEKESSSDDEPTNYRPEAPLNIPHHHVPKIIRREEFTDNIDLSGSGRKRVIGSLDLPLDAMNIDAENATSQIPSSKIPSLGRMPDPTTEVRKEKHDEEKAEKAYSLIDRPEITGKTNR